LQDTGAPVSISHLSEEEQISSVFLEQIFFKLRKAGIVSSVRGPGGGFCFARPLEKLTVKEILEAAGEELNVTECDKHAKACEWRKTRCNAHLVWEDVTRLINQYFEGITLASVLARETPPPLD
jgi:Rrf2 family iron-sulfur cluster assembly transcriptional regulator